MTCSSLTVILMRYNDIQKTWLTSSRLLKLPQDSLDFTFATIMKIGD